MPPGFALVTLVGSANFHPPSCPSRSALQNFSQDALFILPHNRLLVIMSRLKTTDLEKYFQYELTALFTDHGMRKTNKAALTKELRKNLGKSPMLNELPRMYVIDGGCLLHRVGWTETGTCAESCIIVFDGYNSGPTVKDQEHVRRAKNCSPVIDVTESNPVYRNQSASLMNANNKQ